jgi:leucyl/phenylalanyl-tRNA--protein transferase
MFSRATDASKMAFVAAVQHLSRSDYSLIDCQVESEHLNSLGARNITRLDFESHLEHTDLREQAASPWTLDIEAGELL